MRVRQEEPARGGLVREQPGNGSVAEWSKKML